MTTRLSQSRSGRRGFTLVELLVVITVIGLLVGMLSIAVFPALTRAKEARIQIEMKQIEQALEEFKNDYDFYPPSFIGMTPATLARYIGRIAPNHREGNGDPGTPLRAWWDAVGVNIEADHGDDLVFWLSGLCKNSQFPLTNNGTMTPSAFDDDPAIERNVYYDFRRSQLEVDGVAAHYNQAEGAEASYLYVDAAHYGTATGTEFDGYHVLNEISSPAEEVYENPNTFQLICPGTDKEFGPMTTQLARQTAVGYEGLEDLIDRSAAGLDASDNICNFCEGRLELITNGVRRSQAIQY